MSEYEKIYNEYIEQFKEKVKELRRNCTHEEFTDWVTPTIVLDHQPYIRYPSDYEVRYCKRCNMKEKYNKSIKR